VNPANKSPSLATPTLISSWGDIQRYLTALVFSLINELREHAFIINRSMIDEYLKTELPSVTENKGRIIMVSNEVGGYTAAFSDGTNWRRVQDRAIVS
jgi:hypothetical protein